MTDRHVHITRRSVLGSLGAIGIAGAGAGLGTSAYFNDAESFENNTLTAGELDLRVDWEEHYVDGSDDEDDGLEGPLDIQMTEPSDPTDYVGLPVPTDPLIWVHRDDLEMFMDNTSIEAFPDSDNDGIQDDLSQYDACVDFAQLDEDLNPTGLRSDNEDTRLANDDPAPLVNLHDVKPGDFGELTLSFHLCDNPGYVWLQGGLVSADENGTTEPEAPVDTAGEVELLDAVQTCLWYDEDGDNVFEPQGEAGGKVDVVLVLDRSGSMSGTRMTNAKTAAKNLVDALTLGPDAAQVGIVSFASNESLDHGLSTDASSVKTAIDNLIASGQTNMEGGVNGGEEELRGSESGTDFSAQVTPSGNDRTDADKVMVVLSDGEPNIDDDSSGNYPGDASTSPIQESSRAKGNGVEIYTIGLGISSGSSQANLLEDMASTPKDTHFYLGGAGELTQIFAQISQQIAGEKKFFDGTLRELLGAVADGDGIALDGDRATAFDETTDPDDAEGRDEFVNSTNNFVGLAWWVDPSVGNEIQSDSVSFDLGFYTEQSRHNDGSGQTA